jgi:glycosyltransferase involved in cell wall biosynthesis
MTMQVMFFAPSLGKGGADRVLLTLLKHLDRSRFQPSLVLVRRDGPWLGDVPSDVRVLELGARRLATSLPRLVPVLRRERPDVVFSLQAGANVIAAIAHTLARSKARLVLSERSTLKRPDWSRARSAIELPLKRVTYRRADVVTALSQGVGRELHAMLAVPEAKIRVIYNPTVDDDLVAQSRDRVEHPWFADDVPIVLAVGRLVEIKDYPTLLAAFARVHAQKRARLVVLGDGPLRESLVARAGSLGISDDVAFLGFDKNPFRYMARARVMIHASRAEGLGSVIIQAMACGTPIVATDCDYGPRELITSGRDGFLVGVGEPAQIAERVSQLLVDDALAKRVSAEAAKSALRFTVPEAMARFEEAIAG